MTNGDGVAANLLQVSQASRALYAQFYFGSSAEFIFVYGYAPVLTDMMSWAHVLPTQHVNLIERVVVISRDEPYPEHFGASSDNDTKKMRSHYLGHMASKCVFCYVQFGDGMGFDEETKGQAMNYAFGFNRIAKFLK